MGVDDPLDAASSDDVVDDPLVDSNFRDQAKAWNATWTLSTTFDASVAAGERATLVLDGVKMGATIRLNGVALGDAADQFLRYAFDLRNASVDADRKVAPPHRRRSLVDLVDASLHHRLEVAQAARCVATSLGAAFDVRADATVGEMLARGRDRFG